MGPKTGLDIVGKIKVSYPCRASHPDSTAVQTMVKISYEIITNLFCMEEGKQV
jgi:hypothetical protein